MPEVLQTGLPAATLTRAVITPFSGGFKHVLVMVVVVFDELLEQQAAQELSDQPTAHGGSQHWGQHQLVLAYLPRALQETR